MSGRDGGMQAWQEQVGRNIRLRRESRGLSQNGLARMTGAAQSTVSLIESGQRGLSAEMLYLIAEALGCSPAGLVQHAHKRKAA
jgi:transcriptional regulator with XRE-family HTH domain